MRRQWRRRLLVALLAASAFVALTAQSCGPGGRNLLRYCGWEVSPKSACSEVPPRHTYDDNTALGKQGQTRPFGRKCQKMFAWNNEGDVWSRSCASDIQVYGRWNDRISTSGPNYSYLLRVKVGNDERYDRIWVEGAASY